MFINNSTLSSDQVNHELTKKKQHSNQVPHGNSAVQYICVTARKCKKNIYKLCYVNSLQMSVVEQFIPNAEQTNVQI